MNYQKIIPIFFAVDDAYIPFLAVALNSLVKNTSKNNFYEINILYSSISNENKEIIKEYEKENIKIIFVDMTAKISCINEKLHTRDYYSKATYYRLFIPNMFGKYKKAVYLDADIVVLDDVAKLYDIDIDEYYLGGVRDGAVFTTKIFQDYVENVIGVRNYQEYFNAGVLVLNLDNLREFNFENKFMYLLNTTQYKVAQDQDYLNRLCKGRVKLIDNNWNVMPIEQLNSIEKDIKLIHYNLNAKPWHYDNILYEKYFWDYAKQTKYYDEILKIKENYTESQKQNDMENAKNLLELAEKETNCVGDDRLYRFIPRRRTNKSPSFEKYNSRLEVIDKIKDFEEQGIFDVDPEEDPPTIPLLPNEVDYLNKKITSKIKAKLAYNIAQRYVDELIRENKLIIKQINGLEKLSNIQGGGIITCNHFNPFDCFAIEEVFKLSGQSKKKKLYKVIREGNYTNFPGLYGFFFRNCYTLPLSSNIETMKEFMHAIDDTLSQNNFVLIYPEQSMWWNYRKPKPLKNGAFRFASKNNVPIIPIFITMEDTNIIGDDGFPVQEYIINISDPIYPDKNKNLKNNIETLKTQNYISWKNIYESFYNIPLTYNTIHDNENVNV